MRDADGFWGFIGVVIAFVLIIAVIVLNAKAAPPPEPLILKSAEEPIERDSTKRGPQKVVQVVYGQLTTWIADNPSVEIDCICPVCKSSSDYRIRRILLWFIDRRNFVGLDCSHDAFHGAYSAFNRLRQEVCKAAGGRFPYFSDADTAYLREVLTAEPIESGRWYVPDEVTREAWPGLYLFLEHSDCDGVISSQNCKVVAEDLTKLLPLVSTEGHGHLARKNGARDVLQQFIEGCLKAHAANQELVFH